MDCDVLNAFQHNTVNAQRKEVKLGQIQVLRRLTNLQMQFLQGVYKKNNPPYAVLSRKEIKL